MFNTIKNKSSKISAVVFCLLLTLTTSCDKFLDVKPVGELPADKLLKDAAGFESAMYGVYATMNKKSLYGETLSHETIELLAQYFNVLGNNERVENTKAYNYTHSAVEEKLTSTWKDMYNNIANVNIVLENLENMSSSSMRHYNLYKGEALGLRAFMHFDLLRLYSANIQNNPGANGIPYSTKFSMKASPFETSTKVYDFILADLLSAEELLAEDSKYISYPKVNPADNYLRDRETHFNLYAVQATLARVYLTKGDKVNAAKYAKKVIDAHKFSLVDKSEVANTFPKGVLSPKETIFGLYSNSFYTSVSSRFYVLTTFSSYVPRTDMQTIYKNEESGVDYRWSAYFLQPLNSNESIRFVKLVEPYTLANQEYARPEGLVLGLNMIRLPEMYYIMAEALIDTDPTTAATYFDAVLVSRGLNRLAERVPVLPLTVERITADRYKEFVGEGQSFFNMKRLNLPIKNTSGATVAASNQIYVWPIPVDEKEFNN